MAVMSTTSVQLPEYIEEAPVFVAYLSSVFLERADPVPKSIISVFSSVVERKYQPSNAEARKEPEPETKESPNSSTLAPVDISPAVIALLNSNRGGSSWLCRPFAFFAAHGGAEPAAISQLSLKRLCR